MKESHRAEGVGTGQGGSEPNVGWHGEIWEVGARVCVCERDTCTQREGRGRGSTHPRVLVKGRGDVTKWDPVWWGETL